MHGNKNINLILNMFAPNHYSPQNAYHLLMEYGGISSLINDLRTDHRTGLSSFNAIDLERRGDLYGKNQQPKGESLLKKSISEERDFMVNLLFYILTLRVCLQLLLYRDILRGFDPLRGTAFTLSIEDELISYVLLMIIIILKALVNVEYFNIDQDQRKYKNQQVYVKRDGEIIRMMESQLKVGDILIVEKRVMSRVDGIILKCENLVVNEAHTILREDSKTKTSIWNLKQNEDDAFILAGSLVITGQAEILVLTVGENCSFRVKREFFEKQNYEYSPLIGKMREMFIKCEQIGKIISLLLPTFLSLKYLLNKTDFSSNNLVWLDFLYILRNYSSFLGFFCFLQRLKILKSLQFFLQGYLSGKFFRIRNKGSLEKISSLDVLFIEGSAISLTKNKQRDDTYYRLDHLAQLSAINRFFKVKIITHEKKQKILQIFGNDIPLKHIYEPISHMNSAQHLEMLMNATFITSCSINDFVENYLPVYEALKYEIGYVSNALAKREIKFPQNILHISFHQLELNEQLAPKIHRPDNRKTGQFWIKLQNKIVMQDVLYEIILKSFVFAKLCNTYLSLFVNNIIIFSLLCWRSLLYGEVFNLYWSLMIIIVNRYTFFTVYRRVAIQSSIYSQRKISLREILKFNIFLVFYYFYVGSKLVEKSNFFIFLLANSLFRVQTLLFKINPKKSISSLLSRGGIFLAVVFLNIIIWWICENQVNHEQITNIYYLLGLMLIFVAYVIIL